MTTNHTRPTARRNTPEITTETQTDLLQWAIAFVAGNDYPRAMAKYGTYLRNVRKTGYTAAPATTEAAFACNLPAAWRLLNQGSAALNA